MSARRPPTAVHFFTEGDGLVVRGTLDPQEALALAVAELDEHYPYEEMLFGVSPAASLGYQEDGYEVVPEAVAAVADLLHGWLAGARPGLYRMNVAPRADREDLGVSWWLATAREPGPGVWRGVLL